MTESAGGGTLARIEAEALEAAPDPAVDPVVLRFLLRAYVLDVLSAGAGRLEAALGAAVDRAERAASLEERAGWSMLLADAAAVTTDERLRRACACVLDQLDSAPGPAGVAAAAMVLDARLRGASALGDAARLSAAVDSLEALVARAYEPGEPLGSLADHASLASAMLTAFDISGRIPYAMLAEELVQTASRAWHGARGREDDAPFEAACQFIGVLRRLARIHRDDDYRARAVVAEDADYDGDAARLASALEPRLARGDAVRFALFGLALLER